MILIALLFAIVVVIAVVVTKRRSASEPRRILETPTREPSGSIEPPPYVEALLSRWTAAGVITSELAERIRIFERSAVAAEVPMSKRPSHVSAIAEALGYLGGVLGLVGVVVLLGEFWDDFSEPIRLGVPVAATIVFVVAGFVVQEHRNSAMFRLRTFLWFLGSVAAGIAAWVFSDVVLDVSEIRRKWLAVGIAATIIGFSLWIGRARPVQHFIGLAGSAITIGTTIGEFASAGFSGIGIWVAGAILLAMTVRKVDLRAHVNQVAGSIAMIVGAYLTLSDWMGPGLLFVLVSGLSLIAPAAIRRIGLPSPTPLILGIVGLLALVQGAPATIVHFSQDAGLLTGLSVWLIGVITLVLVGRSVVRMETVFLLVSGVMIIGGAAVTGSQLVGFATLFGLITSVALIVVGAKPGRALMSVFGLVGIMVFIPWMISHFFPGQGRVPLLIIVSGLLLVGVAVVLTRIGGRLKGEVGIGSGSDHRG